MGSQLTSVGTQMPVSLEFCRRKYPMKCVFFRGTVNHHPCMHTERVPPDSS